MTIRATIMLRCEQDPDGEAHEIDAKSPGQAMKLADEWLSKELEYMAPNEKFTASLTIERV